MPSSDDISEFPHGFIRRMDAGEFDGRLSDELAKLSKEQLEELSQIVMERDGKRRRRPR